MLRRTMGLSALLGALLLASGGAVAADAAQEPIFGSQLMTEQERTVHRARMWAAENDEARNAIRAEHHEQMRARAQERGVSLPEVPPAAQSTGWTPISARKEHMPTSRSSSP